MVQACELASSILNMSKADIDELLDVDIYEVLHRIVVNMELSNINKVSLVLVSSCSILAEPLGRTV